MNKKKTCSLKQKISNSKLDIVKKSLLFMIAPIMILLVGVILFCSTGFNYGIDFTGGQTFKVYVNDEAKIAGATQYDLNKKEDYKTVYEKITIVLEENGVNLVSYQTTSVNIQSYDVYGGQAVQVTYQAEQNFDNLTLRTQIVDAFGYEDFDGAVSSVDEVPAVSSFAWAIGLLAGIMFALVAVIVYMSFRFSKSAIFVVFIQTALDVLLTVALLAICRVPVNLTISIVILTAFALSIANSFAFYNKVREGKKSGIFTNEINSEIANSVAKQSMYKKVLAYAIAIFTTLLVVILSVSAVRAVALGILLALVASFYTSTFMLPTFWAIVDKKKQVKKKA